MRKPILCICENKDADQLRGNREADQRLCFRYIVKSLYFLNAKAIFCSCTGCFLSDQIGNQNVFFSHGAAHSLLRKTVRQGRQIGLKLGHLLRISSFEYKVLHVM